MSARDDLAAYLAFVCTGNEMRCFDGNGCECAMQGKLPKRPKDDAIRELIADYDALVAAAPTPQSVP